MLKKTMIVLSGTLTRLVLSAGVGLLIAQLVGPYTRGMLSVVMSAAALMGLILGAGLQGSTTFMLASRRWRARDTIVVALPTCFLTALIGTLVMAPLAQRFDFIDSLAGIPVWVVGLGGGLLVLTSLLGSALTGLQLYTAGAVSAISAPVSNGMVFGVMLALGFGGGTSAIAAWLGSLAVSGFLSARALLRADHGSFRRPPEFRFAVHYGARTLLGSVLNYANLRLDVFLLAAMGTLVATGHYSVSVAVSETLWAVPMAIGTVVFPEVASRADRADGVWTTEVCRLTLLVTACTAVLVAVAGSLLFGLVMKHYAGSVLPLLVLLPGTVALAAAKVLGNDLYGRSLPEWHSYAALASLVITFGGDFLLIPMYGATGAALASSVAYVTYSAVIILGFRRHVGASLASLLIPRRSDIDVLVAALTRVVASLGPRIA